MSEGKTVEKVLGRMQRVLESVVDNRDYTNLWADIDALRNALPRWIPVSERMPEGNCLVYLASPSVSGQIHGAEYTANVATIGGHFAFDMPKVTHWMPLPEPPTQEEQV